MLTHFPKISIITPSYNQSQFLEQTILSVLNQNYPNLEYIIIDGGSTDRSVDIIKKYAHQLAYWTSEKDKGQSEAINKGLKRSTGEIITWLNSDDYYEPGSFAKVAETFADQRINIVSGRGRQFKDTITIAFTKGVDVYEGNLAKTIGWVRMDQPETFFRRKVIDEIGLLDERLHYLMDRDWWLKYLLRYGLEGISKIEDVLVNFRLHEGSKTTLKKDDFEVDHHSFFYSLAEQNNFPEIAQIIAGAGKIHSGFQLNIQTPLSRELMKRVFSYYFLLRANILYEQNNKAQAALFYNQVIKDDLEIEDKQLFRKMKWRNKLPLPVIHMLRKFTR